MPVILQAAGIFKFHPTVFPVIYSVFTIYWLIILMQKCKKFLKMQNTPQNSRHQNGGMNKVSYWGPTNNMCHHTKFSRLGNLTFGHPALMVISYYPLLHKTALSKFTLLLPIFLHSLFMLVLQPPLSFTLTPCFPSIPQNIWIFIYSLLLILLLITIFPTLFVNASYKVSNFLHCPPILSNTSPFSGIQSVLFACIPTPTLWLGQSSCSCIAFVLTTFPATMMMMLDVGSSEISVHMYPNVLQATGTFTLTTVTRTPNKRQQQFHQ